LLARSIKRAGGRFIFLSDEEGGEEEDVDVEAEEAEEEVASPSRTLFILAKASCSVSVTAAKNTFFFGLPDTGDLEGEAMLDFNSPVVDVVVDFKVALEVLPPLSDCVSERGVGGRLPMPHPLLGESKSTPPRGVGGRLLTPACNAEVPSEMLFLPLLINGDAASRGETPDMLFLLTGAAGDDTGDSPLMDFRRATLGEDMWSTDGVRVMRVIPMAGGGGLASSADRLFVELEGLAPSVSGRAS